MRMWQWGLGGILVVVSMMIGGGNTLACEGNCQCLVSVSSVPEIQTTEDSVPVAFHTSYTIDGSCGTCTLAISWVVKDASGAVVSSGSVPPVPVHPPGGTHDGQVNGVPVGHTVCQTVTLICTEGTEVCCTSTDTSCTKVVAVQ